MWLLAVTLSFTVPLYEGDPADSLASCKREGLVLERVAKVRLYGAECAPLAVPRLIREHSATGGRRDTFIVWSDSCASYFVAAVDSAGNEGCWASGTVGIPPTTVLPVPMERDVFYDIQGRRFRGPLPNGIFYSVKRKRWVTVLR